MRVSFPQALYDSINGINCQFEIVHGPNVMVREFRRALSVKVVVDQPVDVHVIHTKRLPHFCISEVKKICEFDIALADKIYTYYLREGDVLSLSPAQNGPNPVAHESERFMDKDEAEVTIATTATDEEKKVTEV